MIILAAVSVTLPVIAIVLLSFPKPVHDSVLHFIKRLNNIHHKEH